MNIVKTLWWRDVLHLKREKSRWLGVIAQPLLFWVIIGFGMGNAFQVQTDNGEMNYLTFFYPGTLVMCVLFTTIFASISLIEDRQTGFLQGVMVAPGSRLEIVLGKVAGVTTIAMTQAALFLLVAPLAGYSFAGINWLALVGALLLGCVALTSVNFIMAWLLPSMHAYHAVMSVLLLPLWVLSGSMFPIPEGWFSTIMNLNPMSWFVSTLRLSLDPANYAPSFGFSPAISWTLLTLFALLSTVLAAVICARKGVKS